MQNSERNLVLNVNYNIHYQSDRPSEGHLRDVEAYGKDYSRAINRRTLDICEKKMAAKCIDQNYEAFCVTDVALTVEKSYYNGSTGISSKVKYIPDARYLQYHRKRSDHKITLAQLHEKISDVPREERHCMHAMIIGNQGSGKTLLCKRYAEMALHRGIEELADVEVVHYMDMKKIQKDKKFSIPKLLFRGLIHSDENESRFGWEWIKKNPEKILFIFDQADQYVDRFDEDFFPMSYDEEMEPHEFLQNMLQGSLLHGCHTVIATREWSLRGLYGECRPDKLVLLGSLTINQRSLLTQALFPHESAGVRYFDHLTHKFPISFSMTVDPLLLYFALSSFKFCEQRNIPELGCDTMLAMMIFQHHLRSASTSRKFSRVLKKLRLIAFDMVSKEKIAFRHEDMENYEDFQYEDVEDGIVVAPQKKCILTYRLVPSDYSYFFAHIAFMEILAACHISDMSSGKFNKFLDDDLHTPRWHVVRRLVCGISVNKAVRQFSSYYVEHYNRPCANKGDLLASLRREMQRINDMNTDSKFEILASLHECGEDAGNILSQLKDLCLGGRVLDSPDLYIITRIARHVPFFRSVDLALHCDISTEEFNILVSDVLSKSNEVKIDLSRLQLTSAHTKGLERLRKMSTPNNQKRRVQVYLDASTPAWASQIFRSIEAVTSGLTRYSVTFGNEHTNTTDK